MVGAEWNLDGGAFTSGGVVPSDGAFDETVEPVEATVDTSGLELGQHLLLVRAQDAKGHWGAFSGVFFWVSGGGEGTLAGTVTDAETGDSLAATVSVEPLGWSVDTDPATGEYSLDLPPGTYDVTASADGYTAETQAEMDDFFGSMFGFAEDIWSEFAEEEARQNYESPEFI